MYNSNESTPTGNGQRHVSVHANHLDSRRSSYQRAPIETTAVTTLCYTMTFRITDRPIPSRPFSPSSPPDSIRFDPILSIGRNSIEKNGKNPFREDGDNPEANLIPARIERIDIGFTFAFSQCFSAVAACSAASRVCILLVLFLRRYNNDWGRAHGGRACLPTVHRSERSIDFIDNRSLDNGELHTRRFVASDIERTGRFCLPRERERERLTRRANRR